MAAELLDRINNSEKSLGFLFTKRDNTHLLELCDYIDSNDMDQLRKAEILDIDSRCGFIGDFQAHLCQKRILFGRWHGRCLTSELRFGVIQRR
jgi:hypothetical protein